MERPTARDILASSFREIAETKSVDKISVREICENCGYSTATFYRQFKDKYDLIAWDYVKNTAKIIDRVGTEKDFTWKDTLLEGPLYFRKDIDYLKNLFLNTSGMDSFGDYMVQANYELLRELMLRQSGLVELDREIDMLTRIYCTGTVRFSIDWMLGKFESTPEELAVLYEKALPEPLRKYLVTQ